MEGASAGHAVIGVIGHVDHGKTALVGALTGQDTDRLPEEKARGISIALGFAHLPALADGLGIDLIDMPGHERFVRTMIGGATGIDAVLLVVSAEEGVRPQTREHVDVAGLLGIGRALVAVSKGDLVEPGQADLVGEQASEVLASAGIAVAGVVCSSARSGAGVAELATALRALAADRPARREDGLAFLPVDRAFAMTGHGPVVTGTLRGAAIRAGETLELWPGPRPVRLRSLQVHRQSVAEAWPGSRVAANLRGVEIGELHRGMALAAPGALAPTEWVSLALRSVSGAPPLRNGMRLRALVGTGEVEARLRLLEGDELAPGAATLAQLRLAEDLALPARERVVLRLISPLKSGVCTVAGGLVLEPVARRRKRGDVGVLAALAELREATPEAIVALRFARAGNRGVALAELSRLSALAPERVLALLPGLGAEVDRAGLVLPAAEAERRRRKLTVARDPERERAEAELVAALAEELRAAGLSPPRPDEIGASPARRRAAERLLRDGVLLRCTDRAKGKEIWFHREAVAQARAILEPLLPVLPAGGGEGAAGLLVTDIAAALGISRKYTMPLLDYLDAQRFTYRVGDRRLRGPR